MLVARRKSIMKIAKDSNEAVKLPLVGVNNVIAFDLDYEKVGLFIVLQIFFFKD